MCAFFFFLSGLRLYSVISGSSRHVFTADQEVWKIVRVSWVYTYIISPSTFQLHLILSRAVVGLRIIFFFAFSTRSGHRDYAMVLFLAL